MTCQSRAGLGRGQFGQRKEANFVRRPELAPGRTEDGLVATLGFSAVNSDSDRAPVVDPVTIAADPI